MTLRIVQRTRARQDILDLIAYIADQNPAAAKRVYSAYERSLATLAATPDIGWPYASDNPKLSGMRAWHIGRYRTYLIFYQHNADTLDVIRVLHGVRDLASILQEETS
jgi:toxin ParE1/3/4